MELGLLALRVVVGALLLGHGAQKLFGWFGGPGLEGTAGFFESLELRPGRSMALCAGLAEALAGVLFALGLLVPVASAFLIATMAVAIATVHRRHGLWATDGGYEYNLVLSAVALALAGVGAGRWSLDHVLGIADAGTGWALAALAVGALGGFVAIAAGRLGARRGGHGGRTRPPLAPAVADLSVLGPAESREPLQGAVTWRRSTVSVKIAAPLQRGRIFR
ncbi:MAG TPA: DoxX family protein [Solirubrobacterales bacterium]